LDTELVAQMKTLLARERGATAETIAHLAELGGEATIDGIQLRCRRHNDYEGRLYFGDRRRGARTCSGTSAPPRH
jgi:hypothetical protein